MLAVCCESGVPGPHAILARCVRARPLEPWPRSPRQAAGSWGKTMSSLARKPSAGAGTLFRRMRVDRLIPRNMGVFPNFV